MHRLSLFFWGTRQLLRWGWPRRIVETYVGLGDELMTSAALRDLHAESGARGTWFLTRYPALHENSGLPISYIPWDARLFRLGMRLRRPIVHLHYSDRDETTGRDMPLPGHYIENLARQLGVRGPVTLKPHFRLDRREKQAAESYAGCIALQSSAQGARLPIPTKQWPVERMQYVADALRQKAGVRVVQLGSADEPLLAGVEDLRGKLAVRQSAAVLANARLFVGLPGGLMHLARAVDCRSVIIYGGRELPAVSGYTANLNLVSNPPCSPCYLIRDCPHDLVCLRDISAREALLGIERELEQPVAPLRLDERRVQATTVE